MKQVSSTDFRKLYNHESQPVEVTAYGGKVIGHWYPAGTEPAVAAATPEARAEAVERFTIRPAHGPRPEFVTTEKRVQDPVELRRLERQRYSEFQSKMYGPKKKPAVE